MSLDMGLQVGRRIAPPRFIAFFVIFVGAAVLLPEPLGLGRGTMLAFDIAAALFLVSALPILRRANDADSIRDRAKANDANRAVLLGLTVLISLVVLVSVANEVSAKGRADVALVIATLALAWLFSNTVYAFHYAHLYYGDADADGTDNRGLDFPKTDEPDYWDFLYFSFTLGMTFQTSDVEMTSGTMRRIAIGQCLAAFAFNLGVLAFTINVLGGGK